MFVQENHRLDIKIFLSLHRVDVAWSMLSQFGPNRGQCCIDY